MRPVPIARRRGLAYLCSMPAAPQALIVAHGQPSDPGPAEAVLAAFTARVAALLPVWSLRSATLAAPGALQAAAGAARAAAGNAPIWVYPMFMADGWFTQSHLPDRLRAAGLAAGQGRQLPPFGLDPGLVALALSGLDAALAGAGAGSAQGWSLLVAAHGSFRSPAPAAMARRLAETIAAARPFTTVRTAFIDQSPRIAEAARDLPAPALCLPLFATAGGHVEIDLPAALAEARFSGPVLPPLGLAEGAPALVAAALADAYAGAARG